MLLFVRLAMMELYLNKYNSLKVNKYRLTFLTFTLKNKKSRKHKAYGL